MLVAFPGGARRPAAGGAVARGSAPRGGATEPARRGAGPIYAPKPTVFYRTPAIFERGQPAKCRPRLQLFIDCDLSYDSDLFFLRKTDRGIGGAQGELRLHGTRSEENLQAERQELTAKLAAAQKTA
eukprot:COSAG05_NODE_10351_length_570_cov_0.751592_2_plen_126_part_01